MQGKRSQVQHTFLSSSGSLVSSILYWNIFIWPSSQLILIKKSEKYLKITCNCNLPEHKF